MGILSALKEISTQTATGLGAVAGGISEALVTTALGLLVAIPGVMMFNYLTGRVEAFDVEMDNSSSELIDYFLKRRGVRRSQLLRRIGFDLEVRAGGGGLLRRCVLTSPRARVGALGRPPEIESRRAGYGT